jgi:hypothetical protein
VSTADESTVADDRGEAFGLATEGNSNLINAKRIVMARKDLKYLVFVIFIFRLQK